MVQIKITLLVGKHGKQTWEKQSPTELVIIYYLEIGWLGSQEVAVPLGRTTYIVKSKHRAYAQGVGDVWKRILFFIKISLFKTENTVAHNLNETLAEKESKTDLPKQT